MGKWVTQISFDQINSEIYQDMESGRPVFQVRYYDMFGIFDGIRHHHGRNPMTWRKIAAYSQTYGIPRNTLAELKRLNHFTDPDQSIIGIIGAFYVWNRYYLDDTGCCGSETVEVTDYYGLRMTQRNDGKGIVKHPRISASRNSSTSKYDPRTSRVGDRNRLDGAFRTHVKGD